MRGILLSLLQVLNRSAGEAAACEEESREIPAWLNAKKHQLFLNAEEIYFSADWVRLMEGDAEVYIDWQEMEFFHYPFVGLNIKMPGFSKARYFSLIIKEEMEDHPLLREFINRLREQPEAQRPRVIPACLLLPE